MQACVQWKCGNGRLRSPYVLLHLPFLLWSLGKLALGWRLKVTSRLTASTQETACISIGWLQPAAIRLSKASGLLTSWWRWHKTMGHPWDTFTNIKPPASQQLAVEVCWTTACSIWEPYNQCGSALEWYIILLVCLCSFHALWRQLVPAIWPFVTPSKRFGWTPYIKTFFEIQKQMSFENSTLTCSRYTMISKVIERLPLHHLIYIDISLPVVST